MSEPRVASARLDALLPSIANGVRAAVATLVPFFLAAALGRAELGWMALGGWLGTLTDPGGLCSTRVKSLASFAILGAVIVPVAERCASSMWLATLMVTLVAFVATLARAFGPAAASVGTMTAVLAAVGTAKVGSTTYAFDALSFVAGAVWATLLSSVVWPVGPHGPVRKAVAAVFDALGAYALAIDAVAADAEPGEAWTAVARSHHRIIRDAIEAALAIALAVRARRPGESALGGDLRELLGMAELQFPQLIALSEELEATPVHARPEYVRGRLRELAATYEAVRQLLRTVKPNVDGTPWVERKTEPSDARGPGILSLRLLLDAERARRLASTQGAGGRVQTSTEPAKPSWWTALLDDARELRDALSVESVFFRHGVRVSVAVAVASVIGHLVSTRPHWITVTAIAVLQPYPGPTTTRAAERVIGTVFGSAVAAIIAMTIRSPLALAAVMFPLSVAAVATKPRSYRLFTFFLTPVFVLIAEKHPGDWWTAVVRAGDSVIGGAIALTTALVVLPDWERARLPDALAEMIDAVSHYRIKVLSANESARTESTDAAIAEARRATGIAIGEAEASLERWLAEPLRKLRSLEEGETAMQLVTHARRLANACTALYTHSSHGIEDDRTREVHLRAIAAYEETLLRRSTRPPPPPLAT